MHLLARLGTEADLAAAIIVSVAGGVACFILGWFAHAAPRAGRLTAEAFQRWLRGE